MNKKIDIYYDVNNSNNCWGMITYTETKYHFPTKRQELIRFPNYRAMVEYIKINFDSNSFTYHKIDYSCIEYHFYRDYPEKDYVEIKYYEYLDGKRKAGKIKLPPEFEEMFKEIIKINKGISRYNELDSRYQRDVDVYEQEKNNRREFGKSIRMSLEEFFGLAGDKIKNPDKNKKIIKGLKILVATVTLSAVLGSGYTLVTGGEYHSGYLVQDNPIKSVQDVGIYLKKGNMGIIIEKLINEQYQELNIDDIKNVTEFIKKVEDANYDGNTSHNSFDLSDYFNYKVNINPKDYATSAIVLSNIQKMYNKCFVQKGEKIVLDQKSAKEYIDYVASLTFMYDTYHDTRPSSVSTNNQSVASPYATIDEIKVFDSYPPILRYIILNELKGMIMHTDYKVERKPSYYFKGTDKYDLIGEINERIGLILEELKANCTKNNENRAI